MKDIISYKKKEVDHHKYEYVMEVDEDLQYRLRQRILYIEEVAKNIYQSIFNKNIFTKTSEKRVFFELYSCLKKSIDAINESLMKILKKQIQNEDIGRLS